MLNIYSSQGFETVMSKVHSANEAMLGLNKKLGIEYERDPEDTDYLLTAARLEGSAPPAE